MTTHNTHNRQLSMSPVGSCRVIMKDKLDEYGERLPKYADGKYVTLLSNKYIFLRCDSVQPDRQTYAVS
jgi:hypothetical protein